jgi:ABC-type glycerol-3-phosphate transport system substrate-binding protein
LVLPYEKAHPGVHISIIPPPTGAYQVWEDTVLSAGTAPSLLSPETANTPFQHTSWYLNLDKLVNEPDPYVAGNKPLRDSLQPVAIQSGSFNGGLWSLDITAQDGAIFYNKSMFAKAGIKAVPVTWAQFLADAKKLKADGFTPFGYDGGDVAVADPAASLLYVLESNTMQPVFAKLSGQAGKQVTVNELRSAIQNGSFSVHSPGFAEAWELLKTLSQYFQAGYVGACVSAPSPTCAENAFANGSVAMTYTGQFAEPQFDAGKVGHNYGVFAVPQLTKATWSAVSPLHQNTGVWGAWNALAWSISADSANPGQLPLAENFLQWLATPAHINEFAAQKHTLPMTTNPPLGSGFQGQLNRLFLTSVTHPSPMSEAMVLLLGNGGGQSEQKLVQEYLDGQLSLGAALSQDETVLKSAAAQATWVSSH